MANGSLSQRSGGKRARGVPVSGTRHPDLTDGQKDCLRLVIKHHTSKEIARILGISHFTVDQRLDTARKKLGAPSRVDAARLFYEMDQGTIYESLVYDAQTVAEDQLSAISGEPSNQGGQSEGEIFGSQNPFDSTIIVEKKGYLKTLFSFLAVPPIGGERHSLSKQRVILSSLNIAFYSTITISILIIILTGVMRMIK
jgi:DNA-binding CsgD family transcriptional regulator